MLKSTLYNEWHQSLGQRVCVQESRYGTLRYFGGSHFAEGLWCGIELDEAVGENNGKIDDNCYFSCEDNFGLFVPVSEVSLMKQNSDVNRNSNFSIINQFKAIKQFHNHMEIQKDIHNSDIVNGDKLILCNTSSPKSALNESYTISSDFPDKNKLSIIVEESTQILDISSFTFSQLPHVSGLEKPDDIGSACYANILSQTFSEAVGSNQLNDMHDQNSKENDHSLLESDESLGILPSSLLDLSDDLLCHSETNLKSIVNDMSEKPSNRFQEIISNSPAHWDLDEAFHPTHYATNSSLLCIQNCESPVLQNDSSLPKFASTPKHETNFSDISDEIEKALNLTHNLSSESYVFHNVVETSNKGVDCAKSVSKDGIYIEETRLSVLPVNKSIKDSNVQYDVGVSTKGINCTNPTTKTIEDFTATQCMESIAKDLQHSNVVIETVNLNATHCVEDLKCVKSNGVIEDVNLTNCINYIAISKKDIDLNVTRSLENISEDLKYMSLNESIKEVNVTQCIGSISENMKYNESFGENKALNVTQCIEGFSEDLKNNQSFNKHNKDLNVTQHIACLSEDLNYNRSFNKDNKDLNVTHCIESFSEDLNYDQYFNKDNKNLNVTQCIESISEDLNHKKCLIDYTKDVYLTQSIESISHDLKNKSLDENIKNFNCTQNLENGTEILASLTLTSNKLDHSSEESYNKDENKNEYSSKVRKDLVLHEKTNEVLNIPQGKYLKVPELNLDIESLRFSKLSKVSKKENIKSLKSISKGRGRRSDFHAKSDISSNEFKFKFERHKTRKSVGCFANESELKVGMNENEVRRNSLSSNVSTSSTGDIPEAKVISSSKELPFRCSDKQSVLISNPPRIVACQRKLMSSREIPVSRSGIIENINRNNLRISTLKFESSNFKVDGKKTKQSILVESENEKECLNETIHLSNQINEVEKAVIKNSRSALQNFNKNNYSHSTLKFDPSNCRKEAKQSTQVESKDNKCCLLNETVYLNDQMDDIGKTVVKKRKSMNFSSIRKTDEQNNISYISSGDLLNEDKHSDCETNKVGKAVMKKPRSSMKFSNTQSSSSLHNSNPCKNIKDILLNEVKDLDNQISEGGKAVFKKSRSSMKISSIKKISDRNSMVFGNNDKGLINEGKFLHHQINNVGKTVTKKPRCSTICSSIQSSSSVHNSIPYINVTERLLHNVKYLDFQMEEVGKTVTKKHRSSTNFSSIKKTSPEDNNIPCRSNAESLFNEVKYSNHQINEVGNTVIKKPRRSSNFTTNTQTLPEHSSIPSRNKMTCNKSILPSKCEDYLNKMTKLSIGSALNDKQNKSARIHMQSSSEKPKLYIPPPSSISGTKQLLVFKPLCTIGKGPNYKSTPRKTLKQVGNKHNSNGTTALLSNQESSSSTQKIEAFKSPCIPKSEAHISRSKKECKLDKRAISNDAGLLSQGASCKQTTEDKYCHQMNPRKTGSSVSRIKPPAKYCSR